MSGEGSWTDPMEFRPSRFDKSNGESRADRGRRDGESYGCFQRSSAFQCSFEIEEERELNVRTIKYLTLQPDLHWLSIFVCSQCGLLPYFYAILPIFMILLLCPFSKFDRT